MTTTPRHARFALCAGATLVGALLAGASTAWADPPPTVIPAKPHAPFDILLDGNPGTGYVWQFNPRASARPDLVAVASSGYGQPDGNRPGAPAPFTFIVTPLSVGSATLVFEYLRPWENDPLRREARRIDIRP